MVKRTGDEGVTLSMKIIQRDRKTSTDRPASRTAKPLFVVTGMLFWMTINSDVAWFLGKTGVRYRPALCGYGN
jgi:hypothetical protein